MLTVTEQPDTFTIAAPASGIPGPAPGHWTYADYAALPDDSQRYEVIEGVLYMAPAPLVAHQRASVRFVAHLMAHVEFAGLGVVIGAPVDVELAPGDIVQPDIVVVLNEHESIIQERRIVGTPDLVVEVASPSTAGYDRREKQDAYARAGVPEYWIADPAAKTIEVLVLVPEQRAYQSRRVFRGQATLPSHIVTDLPVKVEQFFV